MLNESEREKHEPLSAVMDEKAQTKSYGICFAICNNKNIFSAL